jgi:hypothetical protein
MAVRLDHGEDSLAEMHGINVTPFIDVMLVLLIIFMWRRRSRPSTFWSTFRPRRPSRSRGPPRRNS